MIDTLIVITLFILSISSIVVLKHVLDTMEDKEKSATESVVKDDNTADFDYTEKDLSPGSNVVINDGKVIVNDEVVEENNSGDAQEREKKNLYYYGNSSNNFDNVYTFGGYRNT